MAEVFRNVPVRVAKMAGDHEEMDIVAHRLMNVAQLLAAPHIDTRNYYSNMEVKNVPGRKGVRDRQVQANDPAAISIEYGHFNTWAKRHIEGQFILTRAIAAIPGYKHTYGAGGVNNA
jgi:hypothetical protein